MIVIDTSALIAITLDEPRANECRGAMFAAIGGIHISAATLAEALIVSARRGFRPAMAELLGSALLNVAPVTAEVARQAADAYDRWGKGVHPAALNICDCFAYALAAARDCPLLYVGADFAATDIRAAI